MKLCQSFIELSLTKESYDVLLFFEFFQNIIQDLYQIIIFSINNVQLFLKSCYKGQDIHNNEEMQSTHSCFGYEEVLEHEAQKHEKNHIQRECVFVDFNAWEFFRSDDLWASIIRNLYHEVELRLKKHNKKNMPDQYQARRTDKKEKR